LKSKSSANSAKGFGVSQRSAQTGRSPQSPPEATASLAPYVRSLPLVIDAMLELGQVTAEDCVYDLGCGDGRMLLTAAQRRGVRGLGVDIDPERIKEANAAAHQLGLLSQVRFQQQDLLTLDLSPATVVMFYLLPQSNLKLRQKLQRELAPGSCILTHSFDMGDWPPTGTAQVSDVINTYNIYLWRV